MSSLPHDKPSTADLVAPKPERPPVEPRDEVRDKVRRMERGPQPPPGGTTPPTERPGALLLAEEISRFRERWDTIQTGFVDEPRGAVQEADSLVAEMMRRLAEVFANEREHLERQWREGQDVSTEDLRVALKRYRSFFDRLLSI